MRRDLFWQREKRRRIAAEGVGLRRLGARTRYGQRVWHEILDLLKFPMRTVQADQLRWNGAWARVAEDRRLLARRVR